MHTIGNNTAVHVQIPHMKVVLRNSNKLPALLALYRHVARAANLRSVIN